MTDPHTPNLPARRRRSKTDPATYVPPEGLTDRDRAFADAVVACGSPAKAIRMVDPGIKFAPQQASYLLRKPAVRKYIAEMRKAAQADSIASAVEIAERHTTIARTIVGDFLDPETGWIDPTKIRDRRLGLAIESVKIRREKIAGREGGDAEVVEVKLVPKYRADETIRRIMGYDAPSKTEHTGSVSIEAVPAAPARDLSRLTSEELRLLRELERKATPRLPGEPGAIAIETVAERVPAGGKP